MILTDEMLSAALRFRDTELWNTINETDLFAVKLSSGEIGYCCVMGAQGDHFALALYIGRQGFSSYLRTVVDASKISSYGDLFEMSMTFDCINCDLMAAKDIDDDVKKRIKGYAAAHGLKIRRPKGWPDFVRRRPYMPEYGITDEQDAKSITEALLAAIEVSDAFDNGREKGFKFRDKYPSRRGGMVVPLLTPMGDGKYEWSTTKLPPYVELEASPAVHYHNDIMAYKVGKLPKGPNVIARAVYLPFPERLEGAEAPVYLMLLLLMNANNGFLFTPVQLENTERGLLEGLDELGNIMCHSKSKPATLIVDDDRTKSLLQDFCRKCGITFKESKERFKDIDEAYAMFLNPMGFGM